MLDPKLCELFPPPDSVLSRRTLALPLPLFYSAGSMAVTLPTTSAAPAPAVPLRPLSRADLNAELTKLLLHGYGSLLVKIHDHRITALECTTRHLEGKGEEG